MNSLEIRMPGGRRYPMKRSFVVAIALLCLPAMALGQTRQTRFWNLTDYTISDFSLARAGSTNWGPNQCKNDRDGTVSPNERLRITDTEPGTYDARIKDTDGRLCYARNVKVEAGEIFSIEEKDLAD